MDSEFITVIENLREDISEAPSYKDSLDDFRVYVNIRARNNKSRIWLDIYQQAYYLSEVIESSFLNDIQDKVIENLKIDRTARSRAFAKADVTFNQSGELSQQSQLEVQEKTKTIKNNLDPNDADLETSTAIRRTERSLKKHNVDELIDHQNGIINERELVNILKNSDPDDGSIDDFTEDVMSEFASVFEHVDEQYRNHVESIYNSLLSACNGDAEGEEEALEHILEEINKIQGDWHREANGWPE